MNIRRTKIKVKRLYNNAIIPTVCSEEAAGLDLHASNTEPIHISPHETVKIGTGLAIQLPKRTFGAIFARSGLATKEGLSPANKVGVIDSDYRGEVIVALHNHSNMSRIINPGERIAQLVVMPYIPVKFKEVNELDDTERGDGGFGSTGTN